MRTVFLGTSEFAATVLQRLAASAHRPTLVVTRPDRRRGRGRRLSAPPVAQAATELGLPLAQPEDVNAPDSQARIAAERPQSVLVCAFGALIREPLLSAHPILNVHPSLLPRWRGAAPIERAIMSGEQSTGVSIMELTAGLDSGPVRVQRSEPILRQDTYGSLAPRLAQLGSELLLQVLDEDPPAVAQDDSRATYAEKIVAEDRELRPDRPARQLECTVRGLTPHIGAFLSVAPVDHLGVLGARVIPDGPPPGVLAVDGSVPVLGTAAGALELLRVKPAGGREMSGEDFLRGRRAGG